MRLRAALARRLDVRRNIDDEILLPLFDPDWYTSFHGIGKLQPDDSAFAHYLRAGMSLRFSPGPTFDEAAYLHDHPDVAAAVAASSGRRWPRSGHEHYVSVGRGQGRSRRAIAAGAPGSATHPMHSSFADAVRGEFDAAWYEAEYPDVASGIVDGSTVTPLWHYLTVGGPAGRSPNRWFNERWYVQRYHDVAAAKARGASVNGFHHYVRYGRREGRKANPEEAALEDYAGLARPVGLERMRDVGLKIRAFPFKVDAPDDERRVNVLVPTLERHLVFGGYIALLNFVDRLIDRGWPVRMLITEDEECDPYGLREQFCDHELGHRVLERADVINLARRTQLLDVRKGDRFIAYTMWTAHHAATFAQPTGRRHLSFVQEFEPSFHQHDCWHALGSSMYRLPHFAIFNSTFLQRFFEHERVGVFAHGTDVGRASSVVFEHALSVPQPPTEADLDRGDGPRRVLLYARPEAHNARNLFEVALLGLRQAVAEGAFDDGDWEFLGLGTLGVETDVRLGNGRTLALRPRLGIDDYAASLRRYDVGLSLQYTPHPGVVHFEMAASGVMTVTNTFANRGVEDLVAVSPNLVPVEPSPRCVAEGLADAARRSKDLAARVDGATRPWVTSWEQSFNDELMTAIEDELG